MKECRRSMGSTMNRVMGRFLSRPLVPTSKAEVQIIAPGVFKKGSRNFDSKNSKRLPFRIPKLEPYETRAGSAGLPSGPPGKNVNGQYG